MPPSSPTLPANLADALIPNLPPSAYYIPNFITDTEEAHILSKATPPYAFPPRRPVPPLISLLFSETDQLCSSFPVEDPLSSPSSGLPFAAFSCKHTSGLASPIMALRSHNSAPALITVISFLV